LDLGRLGSPVFLTEVNLTRLWKRFDGEPFMINPRLGILGLGAFNPKKGRKRGKKMARKFGARHMAWVRSFKRKGRKNRSHRHRRNAYPVAGLVANPRRRRRYHARRNPRRHRRYRRNPGMTRLMGFSLPNISNVIYAGVGYVGVPLAEGILGSMLPLSITGTSIGKYAVRIGSVIGLTWLTKAVMGKEQARYVGIGGGAYVLITAVREFAPGLIPGLSAYTLPSRGMSAYVPGVGRNYTALGGMAGPFVSSGTADVTQRRFSRL
jgi:hypothetical protein